MADITLEKPKAGEHVTVPAHAGARFVIEFDTSEATPSKDGSSFIFTFEDGSSITITNFYGVGDTSSLSTFYLNDVALSPEIFLDDFLAEHIEFDEKTLLNINTALQHEQDTSSHNEDHADTLENESLQGFAYEDFSADADNSVANGEDELFFDTTYVFLHDEDTFAPAEDLFSGAQDIASHAKSAKSADNDFVYMDLDNLFMHDDVYTTHEASTETLDVLLATKGTLESVRDMFTNDESTSMEMALLSDTFQGESIHDALHEAGVVKNTDGSISLSKGWQANHSTDNFTQYTHDESDSTLLVHQTLIVTAS